MCVTGTGSAKWGSDDGSTHCSNAQRPGTCQNVLTFDMTISPESAYHLARWQQAAGTLKGAVQEIG